jgi:23S rRNA pseudouridine1911/1915/1917 synthase
MKWARRDSNISYSFSSLSSTSSSPHDISIQKDKQSHHDEIKNDKTVNKITLEMLSQELSRAFLKNDTDGILQIAPKIRKQSFTGQELIMSAMEAIQNQKGQAAAILNGLIASCTALPAENEHTIDNARCAWDIYTAWEELKDELDLYPDLVTFCCTYSALKRAAVALESSEEKEVWYDHLQHVLEKAQRYSKKLAGSKRRKLLNTISRKRAGAKRNNADSIIAKDHLGYFQETYGEDFDILYEDNDTLVVNKPSGMICFHSHKTTSGKIKRKKKGNKKSKGRNEEMVNDGDKEDINDMDDSDVSLEDALLNVGITLSTLNPDALGIVHRIDRGTSGCIVLAKNDDAHARLLTEFFTRRVQKQYTALVPFEVQKKLDNRSFDELQPSGIIDEAVGGKQALSLYKVVRRVGTSALLLDIHTKTGRKHQVRVHCASALGRPIFLDPLHNDLKKSSLLIPQPSKNDGKHFCLHASSLTINEFGIKVQSSFPKWWIPILECFEKQ